MRRLCFGGSFNPVHFGHLRCSQEAASTAGFERVVLIVAGQPPHKPKDTELAAPEHRLAMTRLAVENEPLFEVEDLELRRAGPSFTLLTARELRRHGWGRVSWLIGADTVRNLPKWHKPLELLDEVDFVLMARPGFQFNWQELPEAYRKLKDAIVQVPQIDISGTEIRRRVREGQSIDEMTPRAVVEYIRAHGLYR
ncbi:MAG: nicotinate (nicotinamide) nucleotide adenylyltransferase [Tepidisphaeraceae bacterium]